MLLDVTDVCMVGSSTCRPPPPPTPSSIEMSVKKVCDFEELYLCLPFKAFKNVSPSDLASLLTTTSFFQQ